MINRSKKRKPGGTGAGQRVVTAVDRAARVLAAFGQSWDFLSLPEVATRSGLSKPTAFRILSTLAAEGLVFQNEANNTYGLGFLTLRLADVVLGGIDIRQAARPAMRRIRDQINETVVLSIRHGDVCFNVDSLDSTQSVGPAHVLGVAAPLHALAPGRALLASCPDSEIAAYLGRMQPKPKPAFAQQLMRDIDGIRKRGYAASAGEVMRAGHTLARAIPGPGGVATAALHISFPQSRFTRALEQRCAEALEASILDIGSGSRSGLGPG